MTKCKNILFVRAGYNTLSLINDRKEQWTHNPPDMFIQVWHRDRRTHQTQTYRGEFLDEVMGHVHQILIFLHVLLEAPALLLL